MWRVRPARAGDLPAIVALARLAGGGFTNLPADEGALARRLDWACASLARRLDAPDDELYLLLLENTATGQIGGTAMLFSRVGVRAPFYSYRVCTLSKHSRELGRTVRAEYLSLTSDFDGASEVGGLFLHPDLRKPKGGAISLGRLLARARYLFIARHRRRFGMTVLAELRGVQDDAGHSPFWDAVCRPFFGMDFPTADRFNAIHGNQCIADLMPRHPIYTALLPDAARAVIGQPHASGRPALAMLLAEGFVHDSYVDVFDGGPTVSARIDDLASVRTARTTVIGALADGVAAPCHVVASGTLAGFQAFAAPVGDAGNDAGRAAILPAGIAGPLDLAPGTEITHAP